MKVNEVSSWVCWHLGNLVQFAPPFLEPDSGRLLVESKYLRISKLYIYKQKGDVYLFPWSRPRLLRSSCRVSSRRLSNLKVLVRGPITLKSCSPPRPSFFSLRKWNDLWTDKKVSKRTPTTPPPFSTIIVVTETSWVTGRHLFSFTAGFFPTSGSCVFVNESVDVSSGLLNSP